MASKHSITTEHGIGSISVGCLVDVASRTWPGINRPGGVARVTRVYEDAAVVDVSYMVGRSREKRVPLDYVTLAPQYETAETQGLRDRTLLLGRCRRCGSLRTDCGSCDWATEEKEQQNRQEQGNKEAVAEAAKMAREKFNKSADVEDSSEDSSEDDTALQDLLRTSQKGYKQHLRNREKWNALRESWIGNSDGGSLEEQPIHNQQQSASDDEDDEDVEELWQQSQRRYRRHIRQRVKWQRRISTTHEATNSAITSIRRDNHRSILETLGSATLHSESQKNGRRNVSKEKGESTLPISKAAQRNIDQSLIGVAKSSSPQLYQTDSVFPLNDDSESDHSSLDHHHRIASSLNDEKTTHDDPDAAFIQPEGRKAAENLPEDMVDQTKTIPYTQLPDFFNRTVADLEDRVLPDIGLRLAELRRQERRISSPRRLESIPISVVALLQQCYELWNEVTHQLIRNGTDQCRAALRRLSDDRLFRKNRKNLTLQQRKQLWSTASMDARHLRLDALEDSVETLVRQLKTVALALENHPSQELESEEGEGSAIFANCSEESEEEVEYDKDDYETQDLVPMHQMDQSSVVLDPCERPMGEFDPHQHAHKKRMNKRSHKNIINPVNTYRSGRPAEKTKKRAKTSPTRNPVIDCIENDDVNRNASACKSRSRLPSGDQASQEQPPGYFNSYRSDQGTWQIGQKDDDTNIQRSDLLPDIAIAENEESGNEPKSNLFDIETKRAASLRPTASQPRNHRPERDNVGGKCKPQSLPKAFLHSGYEKSMQRHRVPISQRMQAFLDKNNELNWQDDAIVEGETLDSKVDISQRRAQLRNRSSRKSEGNSIRSDRNTRQHSWSKTRPSSTARSSGKKEAITRNGLLGDRSLMEDLLVNFDDATNAPTTNLICSVPRVSASTLSSEIGQSYPNDPIRASRLLHQAHSTLNDNEDGMIELHRTTSTLLKRHGVQTLMELIACQSPQLECHVHLLTTLVRFGGEIQGSKEHFLELILLQMVDAVCAMVHLDGWALRIPNRVGILQLLIPIRDALAEKLPIAEALSCCIVEKLGCQEWRVGVNEDCIFVSSVDPSVWKRFVELGEYSIQRGGESFFPQNGNHVMQ